MGAASPCVAGVRIPDAQFIRDVARRCNMALALTSANLSGQQSTVRIDEFQSLWPKVTRPLARVSASRVQRAITCHHAQGGDTACCLQTRRLLREALGSMGVQAFCWGAVLSLTHLLLLSRLPR